MSTVSQSTEETDNSQERHLEESSPHVSDREQSTLQEPTGELSLSSSDETIESQQNTAISDQDATQPQSFSPQGHQDEFGNDAASTPQLSPPQADISFLSASAASVESSQQDLQISSLNPDQDMSFNHRNHLSVPSANDMNIPNQFSVPSHIAEHLNLSQTMEMMNHGRMFPINQPMRSLGSSSFGVMNPYHLPISNLPPEFRLESSSRLQLPQSQQQDLQTTPETGDGGIPFMSKKWTNWHFQNQNTMQHEPPTAARTQEILVQEMMNQITGQSVFYQGTSISNHHVQVPNMPIQHGMNPFGTGPTLPIHPEGLSASDQNRGNFVNSGQYEAGESSLGSSKMKISWQENSNFSASSNLHLPSWLSPSQGSLSQNNISPAQNPRASSLKNTVYDPLYEEMGLPVDPHLRVFVGRRETSNNDEEHQGSF
ncbi:uncharacterized protein LOC133790573 [Humulus lupulus]|uniref:uncharacterized protein LOC133790573 n=1 Tax=Humulus lupulus TaxID=3486 RepID=UPI002B4039B5|nr:uncharacterized protein LOC133790573 [Humulus lupulus]